MPTLGEIKHAKDMGKRGTSKYTWSACIICGKERWVKSNYPPSKTAKMCVPCANKTIPRPHLQGEKHYAWNGGRYITTTGYVKVYLMPNDPCYPMKDKDGYLFEHRLVMAKHLNRCLMPFEVVHHKNGDKADNRIENLELGTQSAHIKDSHKGYRDGYAKGLVDGRSKQIEELRQEIRLLQFQNKELINRLPKLI